MSDFKASSVPVKVNIYGYLVRFCEVFFKMEESGEPLDFRPSGIAGKCTRIGFSMRVPSSTFKVEEGAREMKIIVNAAQWHKIRNHEDYFVYRAVQQLFDNTFYNTINTLCEEGYKIDQAIRSFEDKYDLINEIYKPDMLRQRYYRIRERMKEL